MDNSPVVVYEKAGHVARVTLNRPHVLNAMNLEMHAALKAVWDDFEEDDEMWVAVLQGAGGRAFSVGQDLKELAAANRSADPPTPSSYGSEGRPGWPRFTERFNLSKPIIAGVDGFALGGGFELALSCDIVIATNSSLFALPEAKLGLVPGAGGAFRLVRQLPQRIAMAMVITGRELGAHQALDFGLINAVVPSAKLEGEIEAWVSDILACSPIAVRALKQAMVSSAHLGLPEAFATRYSWEQRRLASPDVVEGPAAFSEDRSPEWSGYDIS